MELVCTLPLPPVELSPNRASHQHFMLRSRATKNSRFEAFVEFSKARMVTQWTGDKRVEVDIEYRCHSKARGYKPKDVVNALSALKAYLDGMVDAKVVKNDSAVWLKLGSVALYTRAEDAPVKLRGPGVTFTVRAE